MLSVQTVTFLSVSVCLNTNLAWLVAAKGNVEEQNRSTGKEAQEVWQIKRTSHSRDNSQQYST